MVDIIIPSGMHEHVRSYFKSPYEIWRDGYEAKQPKFIRENVRFRHNPQWRTHPMSVTYIASGNSMFWNGIRDLFWIAQLAAASGTVISIVGWL